MLTVRQGRISSPGEFHCKNKSKIGEPSSNPTPIPFNLAAAKKSLTFPYFRTELENHMKIQHNIAAKHKCSICDEILPSPAGTFSQLSLKFHATNSNFYRKVLAEHKLQHCKVISGKCFHCSESINDVNEFKQHIQSHNMKNKSTLELPLHCICCHQLLSSDFEMNLHAK